MIIKGHQYRDTDTAHCPKNQLGFGNRKTLEVTKNKTQGIDSGLILRSCELLISGRLLLHKLITLE